MLKYNAIVCNTNEPFSAVTFSPTALLNFEHKVKDYKQLDLNICT